MQKWLNQSRCRLGCGLRWAQGGIWGGLWCRLVNTTELSMVGGDSAFLSNYFDHLLLLGHIAVLRKMWPIVTDGIVWFLCQDREPVKNGSTDGDIVWVVDLGGHKEPCIRWGSISPHAKWQFRGGKGQPHCKVREFLR